MPSSNHSGQTRLAYDKSFMSCSPCLLSCQASQDNTRTELQLEALAIKGFHSLPHTGTTSPHSTPQDISSASPHCTARPPAESHSGAAAAAAAGSPCNRGYCSAGPACCEAAHLGTHWTWGGGQVSCLPLTPGSIPGTIRTLGLLHKSKDPCQVAKAQHLMSYDRATRASPKHCSTS